jgi:hypothetical protein
VYEGAMGDVCAETQVIPSISISGRYDSNVFRIPPHLLPGRNVSDFAMTVTPQLQVVNNSRFLATNITARAGGNSFINNPELNYISTYLNGFVTLDKWVSQYITGAKLQVSNRLFFTPEPPAFVAGRPDPTAQRTELLVRGIQAARANMFSNTAAARGSVPLSRRISIRGDYQHSILRFGTIFADPRGEGFGFFNTTLHDWSIGSVFQVTRSDALSVNYKTTQMNLSGPGQDAAFIARGVAGEYVKTMNGWEAAVHGGVSYLDRGGAPFMTGGLTVTGKYGPSTSIRAAASREIAPAFFGRGGAFISTAAVVSLEHALTRYVTVTASANYANSETVPIAAFRYNSYDVSGTVSYKITRYVSTALSYGYTKFSITAQQRDQWDVDRHVFMLLVSASFP